MIPKSFYTYQFIDGDLVIYTWKYLELWGEDEAAYTHPASGNITYVQLYNDPEKFESENDVFLSRIDAVYHAVGENTKHDELEIDFTEANAWFDSLEKKDKYEEALDDFYDTEDEEGDE